MKIYFTYVHCPCQTSIEYLRNCFHFQHVFFSSFLILFDRSDEMRPIRILFHCLNWCMFRKNASALDYPAIWLCSPRACSHQSIASLKTFLYHKILHFISVSNVSFSYGNTPTISTVKLLTTRILIYLWAFFCSYWDIYHTK